MLYSVGTFCESSTIRYPMSIYVLAQSEGKQSAKGGVHIMGVNCPRSDLDIIHRGHYLDPYMYKYPNLI